MLTAVLIAGCTKRDENILFNIPYQVEFEIPAGLNTLETHVFEIFNIPTRIDTLLANFNIDPNDLQSINPKESQMEVTLNGLDYSFIREMSVQLFDKDDPDVDVEIFFHPQVPFNTGSRLPLIPSLSNAQDFLLKESINLRVEFQLREFSPQFIPTRLNFVLKAL
ncbi:MAG: hypothetical protein AAF990_05200 [Bacteroidota bacterium]